MIKNSQYLNPPILTLIFVGVAADALLFALSPILPFIAWCGITIFLFTLLLAIRSYEYARKKFYGKTITPDMLPNGDYIIQLIDFSFDLFQIWPAIDGEKYNRDKRYIVAYANDRRYFPQNAPIKTEMLICVSTEILKIKNASGTSKIIRRVIDCAWGDQNAQQVVIVSSN